MKNLLLVTLMLAAAPALASYVGAPSTTADAGPALQLSFLGAQADEKKKEEKPKDEKDEEDFAARELLPV